MKPTKPKRERIEDTHQMAYFAWLRLKYPIVAELTGHIFNEGKRNQILAWKMGMLAGFPDIFMFVPSYVGGELYHGLAIELKRPKDKGKKRGELTSKQERIIALLKEQRYKCHVCYDWVEAKQVTELYLES